MGVKDFSPVVRRPIFNFELHLICMQGENILDEFARSLVAGRIRGQKGWRQNGVLQNGAASDVGSCSAELSTSWLIGRYRVFARLGDVVRFGFISFGWHPVEHSVLHYSPFDFNPLIEHIVVGVMNPAKNFYLKEWRRDFNSLLCEVQTKRKLSPGKFKISATLNAF